MHSLWAVPSPLVWPPSWWSPLNRPLSSHRWTWYRNTGRRTQEQSDAQVSGFLPGLKENRRFIQGCQLELPIMCYFVHKKSLNYGLKSGFCLKTSIPEVGHQFQLCTRNKQLNFAIIWSTCNWFISMPILYHTGPNCWLIFYQNLLKSKSNFLKSMNSYVGLYSLTIYVKTQLN